MSRLALPATLTATLLSGAIFGFFYAWICSTMWGLDAADPRVAIGAMQAMNVSVRNVTFAPAFFGTPFVLGFAALCCWRPARRAALLLAGAALLYFCGGMLLTMNINVPMNEALALVRIPEDIAQAQAIWTAYSQPWQVWNVIRMLVSGLTLALAALALWSLGAATRRPA